MVYGNIDVAQITLYVFWLFFAGLLFYLRREDRREGYPLETEDGRQENPGVVFMAEPKTFILEHGGSVSKPDGDGDARPVAAKPADPWPGSPLIPTGDPMIDGVGPAAYAERSDKPDTYAEGQPRIVPLRVAEGYYLEERDPDPRGMIVVGGDGKDAGKVSDVWVDRCETVIRYLEVDVAGRRALLPMNFARVDGRRGVVNVESIFAHHFANVPALQNPDQVTLREEDRICAYYAGGHLYASLDRAEPLI